MKISNQEYEELVILRYQVNYLHNVIDNCVVKGEEYYLKRAQDAKGSKPYYSEPDIAIRDIYGLMGWEYPARAQKIHDDATELLKKKFETDEED